MKFQKSIVSILSLSAFLLTPILNAAIVVDFTTGSSGFLDGRAADTNTDNGDTWNFSASTPLINDTTLDPGESNKRIYGGITTTWATSQPYNPSFRFVNFNTTLQLQINPGNLAGGTSAKGVFLWNQADFLNGFNSGTVSVGAGSSLSLGITANSGGSTSRFVVNQGGTYYVSNASNTTFGAHTFSVADITTQTWAVLNTTTYTFGSFSPVTLNDVQGVGIFFNLAPSGNNQSIVNINDFQFDVVPEPSATLLGGLGALALLRRKRPA